MPLLSHPSEKVVIETMAFLETLLEFGNENVQNSFDELTRLNDNRVFLILQTLLNSTVVSYEEK